MERTPEVKSERQEVSLEGLSEAMKSDVLRSVAFVERIPKRPQQIISADGRLYSMESDYTYRSKQGAILNPVSVYRALRRYEAMFHLQDDKIKPLKIESGGKEYTFSDESLMYKSGDDWLDPVTTLAYLNVLESSMSETPGQGRPYEEVMDYDSFRSKALDNLNNEMRASVRLEAKWGQDSSESVEEETYSSRGGRARHLPQHQDSDFGFTAGVIVGSALDFF